MNEEKLLTIEKKLDAIDEKIEKILVYSVNDTALKSIIEAYRKVQQ